MDRGEHAGLTRRLLVLAVTVGLLGLLAAWFALLGGALMGGLNPVLLLLANAFLFLDGFDFLVRLLLIHRGAHHTASRRVPPTSVALAATAVAPEVIRAELRPFAVVASVHNTPVEELDAFLAAARPFRDRMWLIDDASTDDTWERVQRAGVHAIHLDVNRHKPGALRELLRELPAEIETVVVLDPDARIRDAGKPGASDLERVLFEFQRSGMAAVCPRLVLREECMLERFQAFEYCLSFSLGRKSLGDHCITSGISIYRRDALAAALEKHTLSIYAEDLKNAFLILGHGERIYYDERLVIETEGKRTWGSWFSQRVGWFYGLLKVYREHVGDAVRTAAIREGSRIAYLYQFVFYMGVLLVLFHPFKVASFGLLTLSAATWADRLLGLGVVPDAIAVHPLYFQIAYAKYAGLALLGVLVAARPGERLRLLTIVPFYFLYVLAHILPATVGYLNWFSLRLFGRRLYRDHFQAESTLRRELLEGRP